ncbi:MAG: DNA/RNA nuclease SfsA [Gammaproteobacteria bacterium]
MLARLVRFSQALIEGRLIRRYKRFLADVELGDGTVITAHTPNTGSMAGCAEPGSRVWLSRSDNPRRKYPYSWELVETTTGVLVGINTGLPPLLVQEAIERGVIGELQGYGTLRREVGYGRERSRIDLLLERGEERCYVEVKNVTLVDEQQRALFPDAVTARGTRHLRELMQVVGTEKARGVMVYCVQREDAERFAPAAMIDPLYARTLAEALSRGVEAIAYRAAVSPGSIELVQSLPVEGL